MEIKISKKLDEKIKNFLDINFTNYEIFYAFSSFPEAMCFVLKNEDNDFIGLKIRDNKIIEICMLKLCSTFYDYAVGNIPGNQFCKIDEFLFMRNEKIIFNNLYERKISYVKDYKEENYEYYNDDSFLDVNEFLTFLKLYDFDNFKKEVNSKVNYKLNTLKISVLRS